ncbi:Dabb family protein [Streptomyces sp. NBC_00059]|uniref:Dabb family protein n=1 Tax=Streptomyces sp. NBC_00059 TaxID=2975635 RepID=UPI002251B669|nr:Dabb family protein [Streptomyces sp. NBC_00059]MCX5415807.1 Dabb family protein [Streptomyces sp. NBC_00059]
MIRHVVLFRFRDGVDWSDPRAVEAEAATAAHPAHIPEILHWEHGRNLNSRAAGYDFGLIGTFADLPAIDRYLSHPDHQAGVAAWQAIATWVVADIPAPAGAQA